MTALSFGLTSAVITSLGMIVGLYAATSSKLAVAAGIIIMAIADGLADAAGMHLSEEAEMEGGRPVHTQREVWMTTIFTFIAECVFILSFAVPLVVLPLKIAVWTAVGWGVFLLLSLNFYIAGTKNESPWHIICEHFLLAMFVIIVSNWAGDLLSLWLK